MQVHASQRRFGREHRAPRKPGYGPQAGLIKHRELRFHALPAGQAERARTLLEGLGSLRISGQPRDTVLTIEYKVTEFTFCGLEAALREQGFHLDGSLYMKMVRALVYFCEDTQLRNLRQPERLIKKSNEIYVQAYAHHPHGDHDDTPTELREYK